MPTKTTYSKGWIPEAVDHRDKVYVPLRVSRAKKRVDLTADCSPVEDQGDIGSCVAQAIVGNLEFLQLKNFNLADKIGFIDLSRLFAYYNMRKFEGNLPADSGGTIRGGIKSLIAYGIVPEKTWPYTTRDMNMEPPKKMYELAAKRVIRNYSSLTTHVHIRPRLDEGYPVIFGAALYESFESARVKNTGIVPMPRSRERMVGGHAMLIVGYDDYKQVYLVRNSWGKDWGMDGYCTIPYAYIARFADDFWTIRG